MGFRVHVPREPDRLSRWIIAALALVFGALAVAMWVGG